MNQLKKHHGICDMCEKDVYRPWTDHHGRKLCCDCVVIEAREPTFDIKRPPIIDELRAFEHRIGCEVGIQNGISFRIVGKYEDGPEVLRWLHDHGAQLQRVGPYTDAEMHPTIDPTRFLFYGFLATE